MRGNEGRIMESRPVRLSQPPKLEDIIGCLKAV